MLDALANAQALDAIIAPVTISSSAAIQQIRTTITVDPVSGRLVRTKIRITKPDLPPARPLDAVSSTSGTSAVIAPNVQASVTLGPAALLSEPALSEPALLSKAAFSDSAPTPAPTKLSTPESRAQNYAPLIEKIAQANSVEGPLVYSVIQAETNFNPLAVSPKGAQGVMQLMPATAERFGVSDSFDPEQNISGGVKYLRFLLDLFQGDYTKTVAAYNAGEKAVARYGGVPPYKETQTYVARVNTHLTAARKNAVPKPAITSTVEAETGEKYNPISVSLGEDGRAYYRTE